MDDSSLQNLIREGAEKYSDIDTAVVYIRRTLDRDKKLRDDWIDRLINSALREKVHWLRHGIRTTLKRTDRGPETVAAVAHIAYASILGDWPFLDKTLGDATKGELLTEIVVEQNQAVGHRRNAAFYSALAHKLTKTNMRVCEKFSSDTATRLWETTAQKEALTKSA